MSELIYKPKGAALEYGEYAFNGYIGCPHNCSYCFNKTGNLSNLFTNEAKLRKCFKDNTDAINQYRKEFIKKESLIKSTNDKSVFLSFVTDPFIETTVNLTLEIIKINAKKDIYTRILTKNASWITDNYYFDIMKPYKNFIKFGFTITNQDILEPNASPNIDRMIALQKLSKLNYYTWISMEPLISFEKGLNIIRDTIDITDEYKIGLESTFIQYDSKDVSQFVNDVEKYIMRTPIHRPIVYFKESIKKYLK
jgi:DNA repair photolyase